jgi:Fuc2NAc and GlcNAc transferase
MIGAVLLFVVTAAVSALVTGRVHAYALHHAVLDHPNDRSSHAAPTPRGGGIGILVAVLLAMLAGVAFGRVEPRLALALGPGTLLLGVVGWMDDRRGLPARVRLAAHTLAAISAVLVLGGLPELQVGTTIVRLGGAGSVLAVVGIVWSTNLFNFMDGIDGLAGSQAMLIAGIAGALLLLRGDSSLATVALALAGAAAGFLYWNWPPARIFMGDVGSGAIGFLLAGIALAGERHQSVPLLSVATLAGVLVFDATMTLVRRLLRGDRPADAHREHAYQRLSRVWGAHRPVTVAAAATALILGALTALMQLRPASTLAVLGVALTMLGVLAVAIERRAPMRQSTKPHV